MELLGLVLNEVLLWRLVLLISLAILITRFLKYVLVSCYTADHALVLPCQHFVGCFHILPKLRSRDSKAAPTMIPPGNSQESI